LGSTARIYNDSATLLLQRPSNSRSGQVLINNANGGIKYYAGNNGAGENGTIAHEFVSDAPSNGTVLARINSYGIGLGANTPSSGTGITFPATQSASSDANTLDDYEEGTWSPTVTSSGGSITSYTSDGTYTKIGRSVLITARVGLTNVGTASGNLNITNFPFTSAGTSMQMPMIVREGNVTGQVYQIFLNNAAVLGTMQTLTGGGISWTNGLSYGAMGVYPAAS